MSILRLIRQLYILNHFERSICKTWNPTKPTSIELGNNMLVVDVALCIELSKRRRNTLAKHIRKHITFEYGREHVE